ncbi:MAG TPA: NTP transferase domain-containing protein [Candidatus Sulfotelmatobacter sp.]|nr:NTP transferase domain-containing protein [Candidatus Sulfotelmatobacter sp.]
MTEGSRITAVVLAAGASTRMGTAKQLLQIDGQPLVQHVLDNVQRSGVGEIILVLGHSAEAIQRELKLEGAKVVFNENFLQGMGTSLKAGLAAVDSKVQAALIILADQPFVRPETLDQLIAAHERTRAQIVIPTFRGFRGNPVLLDRSVFPEVMGLSGDIGCRAIFGEHQDGIVKCEVEDVGILLDIDQKQDYESLRNSKNRREREKNLLQSPDVETRTSAESGEARLQRPELVIVGKDSMALTLARLARLLGFTITVADPLMNLSGMPEADRVLHTLNFSLLAASHDRHVVVASRGACDEEAIEQALDVKSAYVALVANRKRGEEVLRSLRRKGVSQEALTQVRVPAGLEIGAEGPEEVALSILAEIVAKRRKHLSALRNAAKGA